ncbi:MAG TPA: glycosyltransferase family 87 protein, partial [Isosphaeraceae bacterium]|nr:glycosyltransferase family 87 protein [Isosphaeraceae bacterium]
MAGLENFLNRRLERNKVRFVCLTMIGMSVVMLAAAVLGAKARQTAFGPSLGADYAEFYIAGRILNAYPHDRLYDLLLQDRLYHRLMPQAPLHESLPFAYAPFLACVFRPLALLPYTASYLAWLIISAALYGSGLVLLGKTVRRIPSSENSTGRLLAFSFSPFLMECWIGGQVSTIGFFWIALALHCEFHGREVAAGAALAVCSYKPTLLLLVIPMLVLGRRWKFVGGLLASGTILAVTSLIAVGWRGCLGYVRLLVGYTRGTTGKLEGFRLWKLVDLNSFWKQLLDHETNLPQVLFLASICVPLLILAHKWWRSGRFDDDRRKLLWASTLTWTLLANLYVGIYDSILIVLAAFLAADVQYRQESPSTSTLPQ